VEWRPGKAQLKGSSKTRWQKELQEYAAKQKQAYERPRKEKKELKKMMASEWNRKKVGPLPASVAKGAVGKTSIKRNCVIRNTEIRSRNRKCRDELQTVGRFSGETRLSQ